MRGSMRAFRFRAVVADEDEHQDRNRQKDESSGEGSSAQKWRDFERGTDQPDEQAHKERAEAKRERQDQEQRDNL